MSRLPGLDFPHPREDASGLLRVGTSGFSYREWRGEFYPDRLPARSWFAYYSSRFSSVEINSTFYRPPSAAILARWREQAPPAFRFALKASRAITHERKLRDCRDEVARMSSEYAPLGESLSCILFQLPPSLKRDMDLMRRFLRDAGQGLRGAGISPGLAIEFRHTSWNQPEVLSLLAEHGTAFVFHDMEDSDGWTWRDGRLASSEMVLEPAQIVELSSTLMYVRFHGTAGKYAGSYGRERLTPWATLARACLDRGRAVEAYFNNTMDAAAPDDARLFAELVSGREDESRGRPQ
ncbi:hypothetical protein OJF2_53100 [Aquisphaera giovannonii]|uniref:DUF72 domain-containing protein n=1 Tax=Aquisphaera giovannonii TaxID=406548 RepID=A0A5B9W9G5_9BACT|nr:DUF72 domain-containing protein [Aquisphaera giovannonii]QEH36725.1 hypothetical protein OJF2_53100 [Aquisphaera giovannonii]